MLSDEFEGVQINTSKWKVYDRYYHPSDNPTAYLKENVCVNNGHLVISVSYDPDSIVCSSFNPNPPKPFTYFCGKVIAKMPIQYGYLETKCYLPQNCRYRPGFWTYNRPSQSQYDEIDVFEMHHDLEHGDRQFLQNCYHGLKNPDQSKTYQRLTFSTPFTGRESTFGVEILPHEIVFYVNGHVTSHLRYNSELNSNSWNTFTCGDVDEMIPMYAILELAVTKEGLPEGTFPLPYDSCKFDYFRCFKLSRGSVDTYHPTVFIPSDESTKVYPHVILGGTGCTAQISSSTAIWAEQDIILDKGFELSAGTPFSARVISVPDPTNSPLYIQTDSNK